MAAITSTKLVREVEANLASAGTVTVAGAGNGHVITLKKAHKLVLMLKASAVGSNMTIKAGTYPPAESKGQGDYTTQNAGAIGNILVEVVESGRHLQIAAGQVAQVTVEFSTAGDAFWAFEVPA